MCVCESVGGGKGLADHPGQPLPDYIADRKYRKKRRKRDVNFSVSPFWFFCFFYNFAHSSSTKRILNSENRLRRKTQSERVKQNYGGQLLLYSAAFREGLFVTPREEC